MYTQIERDVYRETSFHTDVYASRERDNYTPKYRDIHPNIEMCLYRNMYRCIYRSILAMYLVSTLVLSRKDASPMCPQRSAGDYLTPLLVSKGFLGRAGVEARSAAACWSASRLSAAQ